MADEEKNDYPMPKRRRRCRLYLPSGYSVQRLVWVGAGGAAMFGAVLGDIWLWRLLYG